jgi:glycosyltransferase involved in cell wall biosynthesis
MIKIAFWYDRPQEYSGGLNYIRNLLFALSQSEVKTIQPYIYFGKTVDPKIIDSFRGLGTIIQTSILDRKSLAWFLHKSLFRLFGSLIMLTLLIRKNGISIVSHAENVYGKNLPFRVITWIPDLQYLHLPELFPTLDPTSVTRKIREIATASDALILSSYAALEDYRTIADPSSLSKVTVLQFVSQPIVESRPKAAPISRDTIESKYRFNGQFFFLPNQFWQHKNHAVVFSAVRALKEQGIEVLLLCTGNLLDYRIKDTAHVDELLKFISKNDLSRNIRILGLVDYSDVLNLMRYCVAVINPSRFEGWSSSVEEAKSMGKRLILSNIPVHREQDPLEALFFELNDDKELVQAMSRYWINSSDIISEVEKLSAAENLKQRTLAYAAGYTRIVQDLGIIRQE